MSKTICLFGTYESQFPRTKTIIDASKRNGYEVIECHYPFWELFKEKQVFFSLKSFLGSLFKLCIIYFRLICKYINIKDHNVVIVGYNGYFDMPLAKILTKLRKKPLIYTPVFPLFETTIEDRKHVSKTSYKAKIIHKIDEIGCKLADLIIIETEEYIKYYIEEFGIPKEKFYKIPLGADETNFSPRTSLKSQTGKTKILFYGKFIPLQGIRYIIEATKFLENDKDLDFTIIGSGQLSEEIHALAKMLGVNNVTFIEWIDYEQLPTQIQNADICLGIFGDTPKAQRGIPIKVYEALAMKKPVITGDSPAAREVFIDGFNAKLCEMANGKALAESILHLKNNQKLQGEMAERGHALYNQLFSSTRIARDLKKALNKFSN